MRREEIETHLQISVDELPLLGEALAEDWDTVPTSDFTEASATDKLATDQNDLLASTSETASSSNDANSEQQLPADIIISALSEIKSDMQTIIAGQKALRESVKYLYSVLAPKSVARSSVDQQTTPPILTPSSSQLPLNSEGTSTPRRRPVPAMTPMYVSASENTYLLGGVDGLERDLADYKTALKKVVSRAASKPEAMGRIMCSILVRMEFSDDDLAQKNVTGKTRDPVTKKTVDVAKLDTHIMNAIFRQAKLQFPSFCDNFTESGCLTVRLINDTCKHIHHKLSAQKQD